MKELISKFAFIREIWGGRENCSVSGRLLDNPGVAIISAGVGGGNVSPYNLSLPVRSLQTVDLSAL